MANEDYSSSAFLYLLVPNGLYLNDCGIAYRKPQGIDKRLILSLNDTRREKTKQIIKLLGKVEKLQEDIVSINNLLSERGLPE